MTAAMLITDALSSISKDKRLDYECANQCTSAFDTRFRKETKTKRVDHDDFVLYGPLQMSSTVVLIESKGMEVDDMVPPPSKSVELGDVMSSPREQRHGVRRRGLSFNQMHASRANAWKSMP